MAEQQDQTVFGIDLGTTYSCIAYVDQYGKATVVQNSEGDQLTPSVVLFDPGARVVGKEAKNAALQSPERVVSFVKRHMGEQGWRFEYEGTLYSPEEISSYILKKVVKDAEESLGRPITDVVITCPAYFGTAEREATAMAGKLAGLNVKTIINEPLAAALDYGMQQQRDQVVLVYDLGGGTFDVTMIAVKGGDISEIATGGNDQLGGKDWDEQVMRFLAAQWQQAMGSEKNPLDDPLALEDLRLKAENAKRSLTARTETSVAVVYDGQQANVTLTREKFDALTEYLLTQTIALTRDLLEIAKSKGYDHVDQILLVGGSSRMPQVRDRVMRDLGIEPKMFDPDQSVAKGAAIYGLKVVIDSEYEQQKAGDPTRSESEIVGDIAIKYALPPAKVEDLMNTSPETVSSHSLGVIAVNAQRQEIISNLVQANTRLPCESTRQYVTLDANQSEVLIRIIENNEMTDVADPALGRQIGEARLTGLPERLPAGSPIEVTFTINEQQRLHMRARDLTGGAEIEATVELNNSLSDNERKIAEERVGVLAYA